MRLKLEGSRAVVTGASSGIGVELAKLLAPRVAHLALVARRAERLEALAAELRRAHPALKVTVLPCDLGDLAAVKALGGRLFEAMGEVDVLVNNAGAGDAAFFEQVEWAKLEQLFTLNALAPAWLIRHLLPGMVARGRGGILNVSSGFGLTSLPSFGAYVATKHFLSGLTETLRAEVVGTGVVVTQSCPGPVKTGFEAAFAQPLRVSPPGFLVISAEQCARETFAAFERGAAFVVPSLRMRMVTWLVGVTPRWLLQLVQAGVGRRLR
ncbi:MAG: short-chain dehydrogenase [Myxococcaceae bacterium]|nr:short-chain dehydrogenase [Myxococcaceae bacterium]